MNKKLPLLLLLWYVVCTMQAYCQQPNNLELKYTDNNGAKQPLVIPLDDNRDVVFSSIVLMDGVSAQLLYNKVKLALTEFWRSSKDVTQLDDAESKVIVSKGRTQWIRNKNALFTQGFDLWFSVKIECRDNRYRISIYGFNSYNSTTLYGQTVSISVYPEDALKRGVKKDGTIKSDLYGLSWLAWRDISLESIDRLEMLIKKASPNTSKDW